jgi:hypothetical protein
MRKEVQCRLYFEECKPGAVIAASWPATGIMQTYGSRNSGTAVSCRVGPSAAVAAGKQPYRPAVRKSAHSFMLCIIY